MTPLAHEIVSDSTLQVGRRKHDEAAKALRLLDGVHFFECSAVREAAYALAEDMERRNAISSALAFLPAPRTWIEWHDPEIAPSRIAVLFEQSAPKAPVASTRLILKENGGISVSDAVSFRLGDSADLEQLLGFELDVNKIPGGLGEYNTAARCFAALHYAFLALVNTPRIVGRRQHMPHAGLQRKVAAAHHMPGKYPLGAWHELVLEITPPKTTQDEQETRLSGGKALHFCRCHLRIRLGRLELVSAHWRGDAALGIRQTRYRLAA